MVRLKKKDKRNGIKTVRSEEEKEEKKIASAKNNVDSKHPLQAP